MQNRLFGAATSGIDSRLHLDLMDSVVSRLGGACDLSGPVEGISTLLTYLVNQEFCHYALSVSLEDHAPSAIAEAHSGSHELPQALRPSVVSNLARLASDLSQGEALDITRKFLAELAPGLASQFSQGVVVRHRIPVSHSEGADAVSLVLRSSNTELDPEFIRTIIRIVFSNWYRTSNLQAKRLEALAHDLLEELPTAPSGTEVWNALAEAHCFLSPRTFHRIVSALTLRASLIERQDEFGQIEQFTDEWNESLKANCPFRDQARLAQIAGDAHTWRLQESGSPGAMLRMINHSLSVVREDLQEMGDRVLLDQAMPRLLLGSILGSVRDGTLRIPSQTTEAVRTTKDYLSTLTLETLLEDEPTAYGIEASIDVVSRYCHEALGVDPLIVLDGHLRHLARGEASLHMFRRFYRDHFFHSLEVFSFGLALSAVQSGRRSKPFPLGKGLLNQWGVAALLHDIGYGVDVLKGLRDWLDFFDSSALSEYRNRLDEDMQHVETQDELRRIASEYGFPESEKAAQDHGLLAAHHLEQLLKRSSDGAAYFEYRSAIAAVARHNHHSIPVEYVMSNPLSALLILADTIQSWRRPQYRSYWLAPALFLSSLHGDRELERRHVDMAARCVSNVRIDAVDPPMIRVKPPLVIRVEFGTEVSRDSLVFNLWLDVTRNLQRVDFRGLPFDVVVQFVTPTFREDSDHPPVRQIDRLFDAAQQTHMAYLANWFPKGPQCGDVIPDIYAIDRKWEYLDYPLSYHVDDSPRGPLREMISLSLRRFDGRTYLMEGSMDRFRKDLMGWKDFNVDRLFSGDYFPWRQTR